MLLNFFPNFPPILDQYFVCLDGRRVRERPHEAAPARGTSNGAYFGLALVRRVTLQPANDFVRVFVGRKNGIEHVFDASVRENERQSLQ